MSPSASDLKSHPSALALLDDVVLSVRGVSKKFCRNLRRSMLYGMQDLAWNLAGGRTKRELGSLPRNNQNQQISFLSHCSRATKGRVILAGITSAFVRRLQFQSLVLV